ncbi:MAG TPA: YidC/Oxa1 family membrane protein insertase [Candidatus Sulfotelmatobacter sp.]|jgi:YidC/Oxa1 family membrane protein insertase|nr:YidC/Oxa1 family membrane protein insertase [Candidatus Sulfotelmatobacter sp.]
MNFFDIILINPILNIMVAIYQLLTALHTPSALGFSIVLLTIVIRLILYPLMHQSLRQQRKMQQLTPHINKLKEKHKNDAKRLQVEQMALFKEHGVNPAAGCVVMIIQIPILIGLYNVLLKAVHSTSLNDINSRVYFEGLKLHQLWGINFFGVSLAQTPAQLFHQLGYVVFLVAVITGGLQLIQSRMMMSPSSEQPKKEKKEEPDFATAFQTQSMYLLPIMVGFFSYSLPFGLSLYWNTLTIFGIIQQYIIQGWGGLVDWLPLLKKAEVK